jgi:plastocyanin
MQGDRRPMGGRRFATMLVAVVLAVVMAGGAFAATARIRATSDNDWRRVHTYIGRGDRIQWRNPTNRVHDVHSMGGNWNFSEVLSPGESTSRRFRRTGIFRFRCARHSGVVDGRCRGMCGVIHVLSN